MAAMDDLRPAPAYDVKWTRPASMRMHIRTRPGMYFGGLNAGGVRNLLYGFVDDLLDAPDSRPARVQCILGDDGTYAVEFSGGRLPDLQAADLDPEMIGTEGRPDRFRSWGIACAVSERLDVEVSRDGRQWRASFAEGLPSRPAEVAATADPPAIRVTYRLGAQLFEPATVAAFLPVCGRARDWAVFHPETGFTVDDGATAQRRDFRYPDGLLSLAHELEHYWFDHAWFGNDGTWRCRTVEPDGSAAEVVFVQRPTSASIIHSFLNGWRTCGGGSHVDGVRSGVAAVAATYLAGDFDNPFATGGRVHRDVIQRFAVLVSVRLDQPRYGGSTRERIEDDRAKGLVRRLLVEQLPGEIARTAKRKR
jgi:DNA gyrase subunit B